MGKRRIPSSRSSYAKGLEEGAEAFLAVVTWKLHQAPFNSWSADSKLALVLLMVEKERELLKKAIGALRGRRDVYEVERC